MGRIEPGIANPDAGIGDQADERHPRQSRPAGRLTGKQNFGRGSGNGSILHGAQSNGFPPSLPAVACTLRDP